MPAPGDQYNGNVKNPFKERVVNGFTATEIATLQSRLNKQLGPEYISQRPGNGGGRVAYLEGNKAIALANEVFGFNGWSSSLGQVQIDYVDENTQNGKVSLGLSIVVRITLKDGTYHEDIGYGSIENGKGKAASFEKAKKEAATDGLKRALRTFGNVLGNCLYDKEYLKKVQAMKIKPRKFDEVNLYRHPDYALPAQAPGEAAMVKREPDRTPVKSNAILRTRTEHLTASIGGEFDDEYDGNLFDGVEISENHGDEYSGTTAREDAPKAIEAPKPASGSNGTASTRSTPVTNGANGAPSRPPNPRGQAMPAPRAQNGVQQQQQQNQGPGRPPVIPPNSRGPQTPVQEQPTARPDQSRPRMPPPTVDIHAAPRSVAPNNQPPQNPPLRPSPPLPNRAPTTTNPNLPTGFVTSRAATLVQNPDAATSLTNFPAFNPNVDSPVPKEKRTPGIDHTSSRPIKRQEIGAGQQPPPAGAPPPANPGGGGGFNKPGAAFARPSNTNFVNPQQDLNRRIGMPGGGAAMSPTINRGAYKPPMKRPPLQDVSNSRGAGAVAGKSGLVGEPEAKRQRVEGPVGGGEGTGGVENAAPAAVGSS
ncbi:hypothetical protein K458DRAFT_398746 [Lentithecium fluviatile CBS 122367]|uniref:RAD52 homolog n=1 Tax=Lentithecium fluviatile CBS 122367 TaxID=1168545 RepID=A0A6G1JJM3_9PLEO|nr:hypothetical protein K458DRAFT_398746 [Lentithecium fluviatile CBS 122367]